MIDPVVLGGGKRFFRDDGVCRRLTLAESETTSAGAILATYACSSDTPVGARLLSHGHRGAAEVGRTSEVAGNSPNMGTPLPKIGSTADAP